MNGAKLIAAERQRQLEIEGWTPQHDDEWDDGQLLDAAAAYMCAVIPALAMTRQEYGLSSPPEVWPWHSSWWKPSDDPIRNLVKAGALIAAEIDRQQRAAVQEAG